MRSSLYLKIILGIAAAASVTGAQDRSKIRQLGPVAAKSTEPVTNPTVRVFSSGILVNEPTKRRVILFDSTLSKFTIVADTTLETGNAYAGRFGSLLGYKGDSSLFMDPQSMSMLVIDPSGKIARVMSMPSSQNSFGLGLPGAAYDGLGHLIFRGNPIPRMPAFGPNGPIGTPEFPDSVPILRINLASRALDTLSWVKVQKIKMEMTRSEDGRVSITSQVNPLPVVDEIAILPDGTVALIRGKDYHVDFVNADGSRLSAAKIPFDWQRLTDEDKIALMDSVKVARERLAAATPAVTLGGAGGPQVAIAGGGAGGAAPEINFQFGGPRGSAAPGGATRPAPQMNLVPASELPDYKPAFFAGASRSDNDGNIWIRTIPTKSIPGGPVYDVINRKGELVERVQIPLNSAIVGFDSTGSVYMTVREGDNTFLQRARVR